MVPQISTKARILLHFVPRFGRERDGGGEPRTLFTSFSSLGLSRPAPQTERETFSRVFPTSPLFCIFLCSLFFYFGGRLAGLSMAHICSSSLLVFTTAPGLPPPSLMDGDRDTHTGGGGRRGSTLFKHLSPQTFFFFFPLLVSISQDTVFSAMNILCSTMMMPSWVRYKRFSQFGVE